MAEPLARLRPAADRGLTSPDRSAPHARKGIPTPDPGPGTCGHAAEPSAAGRIRPKAAPGGERPKTPHSAFNRWIQAKAISALRRLQNFRTSSADSSATRTWLTSSTTSDVTCLSLQTTFLLVSAAAGSVVDLKPRADCGQVVRNDQSARARKRRAHVGSGAIENRGPNPGHVPLIAPGFIPRRDFGVFARARSIP